MRDFNSDHCAEFLSLYEGLPGYLWVGKFDPPRGEFFATTSDGIAGAVKYAEKLDYAFECKGLYWRVSTLATPHVAGRGEAKDTLHLPYLFADLDIGTEGHKPSPDGRPNPPTGQDAYALIAEAALPEPTMVIQSGGGLYPLWRLEDSTELKEAEAALQGVQHALATAASAHGWHYGNVGDLTRVLRLPGSTNRKTSNHRPCRVVGWVTQ